jgi:hypothetical protein
MKKLTIHQKEKKDKFSTTKISTSYSYCQSFPKEKENTQV